VSPDPAWPCNEKTVTAEWAAAARAAMGAAGHASAIWLNRKGIK